MAPAWQGYFDDQVYTADLNLARFRSVKSSVDVSHNYIIVF